MPRPKKCRHVLEEPNVRYFKPRGIPLHSLEEVKLTVDEFEAIRLVDVERRTQLDVAEMMGISQPTVHRILRKARMKVGEALVKGRAIRIEGGEYEVGGAQTQVSVHVITNKE